MTITSSDTTSSAHSGKDENTPTCAIALSVANTTAVQRPQLLPAKSPKAVRVITTPTISSAQPQAVKSEMMTPWPPTVTTLSLRIAASPQITLKKPEMNRTMPANMTQPPGEYS